MILPLPKSRAEIRKIQSERKKLAFERAKRARWYQGKLDHIDANKLDDPAEWQKIPIIDKDVLRRMSHAEFMDQLCIVPKEQIAEYWRSGGTTGKPVFYPRTFEDVKYGLLSWGRSFPAMGIGAGDLCHISFPIGIHPAGQIWARSAHDFGVGMSWVGAGNAVPSAAQLELIQTLKPTVLIAMSSFALHLANLADASGIDLRGQSVRKIVCSAETLSDAKREKLGRTWNAEVYDVFGMSEAGLMGAEGRAHDGIHIWTDLFYIEVADPATGRQLPEGEVGTFCVTPLWTGHATPFLRWNSGDLVRYIDQGASGGTYAELFPMIKHAHRTTGFFKVRGVNVNHSEFEDFMFRNPSVNDFQGVLVTDQSALETLRVRVEVKRGVDARIVCAEIASAVKKTFEITPEIELLELGTLAKQFESSIKAPRFVDQRS
jgi:phenylacetate-CoA ligase